jgi:hypothetical protein
LEYGSTGEYTEGLEGFHLPPMGVSARAGHTSRTQGGVTGTMRVRL